jgi:hypothetical protein
MDMLNRVDEVDFVQYVFAKDVSMEREVRISSPLPPSNEL